MALPDVNLVAVLVSSIVGMAIGVLWYSPLLFGKLWMTLNVIPEKQIKAAKKSGMGKLYFANFIGTLVMAYVLSHFVDYAGATTVTGGMQAGFWAWLGFIATVLLGNILWEGKSLKLYLLNIGHYLIVLLAMGAILAVWV